MTVKTFLYNSLLKFEHKVIISIKGIASDLKNIRDIKRVLIVVK